jgi:hypothetical protein
LAVANFETIQSFDRNNEENHEKLNRNIRPSGRDLKAETPEYKAEDLPAVYDSSRSR